MKKIKWILAFVAVGLIISSRSYAQWAATYGASNGWEVAQSIQQTSDGGYVVAGYTCWSFRDFCDIWVLKLGSDGTVTWQKSYELDAYDYAHSVQETSDGGYIVAGTSQWTAFEGVDAWILKLNPDGSVGWQKTYGGDGDDFAESIRQTSDGGYIVAGSRAVAELEDQDIWLLKLNPDGSVAWQKSYGGDRDDYANSVQQTVDGGYIVAGNSVIFSHGSVNDAIWVLKLNSDGTIAWQKTYDLGGWPEVAFSVQQTSDNGYVVAGYASPVVDGVDSDLWVLKLNPDGSVGWQKTYGGGDDERAYSIQQTSDGGYIVAGWTYSFGAGRLDFWIIKLNSDGSVAWEKTYGDAGDDRAFSIQQTSDGGYIVAGKTDSFSDPYDNVLVLKLNARGEIPGCSLMGTSNATTSDTSAVVKNTDVIPIMPSIFPDEPAIFLQDTSAVTTYVCLYSTPTPDIKANGSDGPITISQGKNLAVTVALDPGSHDGEDADWWVVGKTPFGRYWYTLDNGWVRSDPPIRVYGGPLFDIPSREVLNNSGLPIGAYTFYFAVDLLMNGSLDFGELCSDRVDVTIE